VLPKELQDIFEDYTPDDYNLYMTKAHHSGDNLLSSLTWADNFKTHTPLNLITFNLANKTQYDKK